MASLPTDLTRKWWSDNKAITLKSTKLGDALGAWETALAETKDTPKRRFAAYDKASAALKDLQAKVAEAKSACNKTLHGDTIKILDAYPELISKAAGILTRHREQYAVYVKNWADLRKKTKASMIVADREMTDLGKLADNTTATCKKLLSNSKADPTKLAAVMKAAVAEGKKLLNDLDAKQKAINKTLEEARVPKAREESPHADDFPPDAVNLFDECRQLQVHLSATRANAESALKAALKDLGS